MRWCKEVQSLSMSAAQRNTTKSTSTAPSTFPLMNLQAAQVSLGRKTNRWCCIANQGDAQIARQKAFAEPDTRKLKPWAEWKIGELSRDCSKGV